MNKEIVNYEIQWEDAWWQVQRIGRYVGSSTTMISIPQELFERIAMLGERLRPLRMQDMKRGDS